MPCTHTLFLFTVLVLIIPLSGTTNHTVPADPVHGMNQITPDLPSVQKLNCQERWSCQGYDYKRLSTSVTGHYLDRNCACDELCLLLQDCCPDAHLNFPSLAGHRSSKEDSDVSERNSSHDGRKAAVVDPISEFRSLENEHPDPQTNRGKSRNKLSSFGDVSSDRSAGSPRMENKVYSQYGLDKDMFTCINDKGISIANSVSVVTRCPEKYDDVEVMQLCYNVTDDDMMTRLPVSGIVSGVLYRNMYCAMCHEEPYLYWAVGVTCKATRSLSYDVNSTSISDVMNDHQCQLHFQPPNEDYGWRPCQPGVVDRCNHTFPMDTERERHIVKSCEEVADSTQRMVFGYELAYRNQFCSLCNYNNYPSFFCERLPFGLPPLILGARRTPYSFSILLDINTNRGSASVGHSFNRQTVERNESVSCEEGQVFDPFRSTCRPVTCGPGRHFIDNTCRKNQLPNDETSTFIPAKGRQLIPLERNYSFRDISPVFECSFIQLNKTEYHLFPNGTLELLGTGTFYNSSQYILHDGQLHLCVSYTQNYTRTVTAEVSNLTLTFSLTEAIVSTCGICISVVALAVTLFVYLSLRALRNIPGQNLLSLVCSLFLADLLLLVAPSAAEEFLACAVIAGIMHYFFLASFLWMNVMAVDVWFTFSKAFVKAGDRGKSSKRFIMYSVYSWLTPLVFVLSAGLVQMLNPGSPISPRYGEGICWLANKYALLLFFAAPLFLLLLLNIILFILSARNISRAKRTTARMLGKEEEGKMAIYVKLTVVMGITWILGFLAALLPGNQVLIYCFVILNTLQGLFIFISFVCTQKVFNLLKGKFCARRISVSSKSASTDLTNVSKASSANRNMSKSHNTVV